MKDVKKKFSLSFAELCMFTSNLVQSMTRDAAEFAARGVDAAAISALEALGNELEVFPTDGEYLADVEEAVLNKNDQRATVTSQIVYISGFFEQKYGTSHPRYKKLGIDKLRSQSASIFLVTARRVARVAEQYLSEFLSEGLLQTDIDTLNSEAQTFEDDMNAVDDAVELRDIKSRERVEKANNLYDFVAQYCRLGKIIFEQLDESKYNDYVIYKSSATLPSKVMDLNYDSANTKLKWSTTANADSYQLEEKLDNMSASWATIYEGSAIEFIHTPPSAGDWLYRCRGINLAGTGAWSDELLVNQPT